MTDLTMRAEQAMLGALLTDGAKKGELGEVQPQDFADQRHQAIFAALTSGAPQPDGLLSKLRMWLTGLPFWPRVRDFQQYLAELPQTCPDPAHLSTYAQMVTEASQQRRAAAASVEQHTPDHGRIAGAAAYLAREAERAAASRRWPARAPHPATAMAPMRDTAIAARAIPRHQAQPAATEPTPPPEQPLSSAKLEEHVLADLLRHPGQAEEIIGWLPVEVFTSGNCREIYRDIRHRLQLGEPVDPLIIAWDLNRAREVDDGRSSEPDQVLDPAYVLRIGAIAAAPGTAALIGRALLAEQVCTRRLGPDWPQSLQRTPAAPVTAPEPEAAAGSQPLPDSPAKLPQPSKPTGPQPDPAVMEPPPAVAETAGPVQRM